MRRLFALLLIFAVGAAALGATREPMSFYLSALIPTDGLKRAYPLWNDNSVDAALVTTVVDESGNGANLLGMDLGVNGASWDAAGPNSRWVLTANGTKPGITNATDFTMKDVFVLVKSTENPFTAYRGLISDQATNGVLISNNSVTKFYDFATGTTTYYKAGTTYAESNQLAPMNEWAMVQISNSAGWTMDGFQVGDDRAYGTRLWKGSIGDIFAFSRVLTSAERRSVKIYYDLKFKLWLTDGTALYFPDQAATGIRYFHYDAEPLGWEDVTVSNEYEDGGRSFNTVTDTPPRFWTIEYTGLTAAEVEVFDAFSDAVRRSRTFSFVDKEGTTWTNVRIQSYSRSHEGHKSWVKSVKFRLVKYP